MHNIAKSITVFIVLFVILGACDLTKLDLTKNPNAIDPSKGQATLYLNGVQTQFGTFIAKIEVEPSEAVRLLNMDGRIYKDAFEPSRFNPEWRRSYRSIINNIRQMAPIAEKSDFFLHLGIAQVIEAYTIVVLVDLFGDIPYSEALDGNNLNPKPDDGKSVYAAADALLNSAIANFGKAKDAKATPNDLFYGGNWGKWIKAANSIKMRMYVTTRLVDPQASTKFAAIVQSGNFIAGNEDDFQFEWNTSNANPDSRHPRYVEDYTPSGANNYMSNWLMNYMYNEKITNAIGPFNAPDPRMKYYFYRQINSVPLNEPNQIRCTASPAPPHYKANNYTFCTLPDAVGNYKGGDGYWGRDHGDDSGIPPDSQLRTAYGLYPVGGKFDDNSFKSIESISVGAAGVGITPLMLASWVDIMRAEMALAGGNTGQAAIRLQSGVRKSFQKVRAFISRDPSANLSTVPDPALDEAYVSEVGLLFNSALNDGARWDLLGSEYFVTLFGNGLEAFNFYRRTGRPSTLQTNLEPAPGAFFRSFLYPSNASERNSNVTQKSDVLQRVFWDTGVTLLAN